MRAADLAFITGQRGWCSCPLSSAVYSSFHSLVIYIFAENFASSLKFSLQSLQKQLEIAPSSGPLSKSSNSCVYYSIQRFFRRLRAPADDAFASFPQRPRPRPSGTAASPTRPSPLRAGRRSRCLATATSQPPCASTPSATSPGTRIPPLQT